MISVPDATTGLGPLCLNPNTSTDPATQQSVALARYVLEIGAGGRIYARTPRSLSGQTALLCRLFESYAGSGFGKKNQVGRRNFMRKGMVLGLVGAVLTIGAAAGSSYAQTVYPVKFVCGTQQPQVGTNPPAEPAVKPGNYATVINVESLVTDNLVNVSASPAGGSPVDLPPLSALSQFTTKDITCADIEAAVKAPAGTFITGFVNLTAQRNPIAVTAVYTSQGCLFPLQPLSNFVPPVCTGPTSIDVVVQSPVNLPLD